MRHKYELYIYVDCRFVIPGGCLHNGQLSGFSTGRWPCPATNHRSGLYQLHQYSHYVCWFTSNSIWVVTSWGFPQNWHPKSHGLSWNFPIILMAIYWGTTMLTKPWSKIFLRHNPFIDGCVENRKNPIPVNLCKYTGLSSFSLSKLPFWNYNMFRHTQVSQCWLVSLSIYFFR